MPDDPAVTAAAPFAVLRDFALRPSSDEVKQDLELACLICGAHICDAEAGDTLEVLASCAAGHQHTPPR